MKRFNISLYGLLVLFTSLFSTLVHSAELTIEWEVSGFKTPESVVYDPVRDQYYVSNINDGVDQQDNNGSIGLIQGQGEAVTPEWITGLSSPKGLALHERYLFAADVKELVVIDVEKAQITARYPAPDSNILNDIAITPWGTVFISDWAGNRIYRLGRYGLKVWLEDENLESPNGLFVKGHALYVGAWGNDIQADFSTLSSGKLKRISLFTKEIENITQGEPFTNMDGIHYIGNDEWLVTDFLAGSLISINEWYGKEISRITLEPGAADFSYVEAKQQVIVPFFFNNKVVAYRLER